jgi:hypothetical protein
MKKKNDFSRRQFLRVGSTYLAIPFLQSLLPREAWGQTMTFPKRLVSIWTPNGTCYKNWHPSMDPTTVIAPNVRAKNLAEIPGQLSTILGPEISAYRSKLLLLRGLDGMNGDGHNRSEILAGSYPVGGTDTSSAHISMDQILAASPKFYSKEPKTRVLSLMGTHRQANHSFLKSGAEIVRAPFYYDMKVAFESLFSGIGGAPAEIELAKARNLTLVDRVFEDYKRVMTSRQISSVDKLKLDSHMTSLQELQKRINDASVATGCVVPPSGMAYPGGSGLYDNARAEILEPYINNMFDIVVAALRCDLTRMVTLQPWDDGFRFRFIPEMYGDIHTLAHGRNEISDAPLTLVQQYLVKEIAKFIKKLDDVVEDTSDGSKLLDRTAVLWRQEFTSNGDFNHKKIDLPVILAGGGKFLNTGRYVDFRTLGKKRRDYDQTWIGVPYNNLLVTLLTGFGLTPSEFEQVGAGFGHYTGGSLETDGGKVVSYGLTDAVKRAPLFSLLKA